MKFGELDWLHLAEKSMSSSSSERGSCTEILRFFVIDIKRVITINISSKNCDTPFMAYTNCYVFRCRVAILRESL